MARGGSREMRERDPFFFELQRDPQVLLYLTYFPWAILYENWWACQINVSPHFFFWALVMKVDGI